MSFIANKLIHDEHSGYWYLFFISIIAASLEFYIAAFLANSGAAFADATHAFLHSTLYLVALYVAWIIKKKNGNGNTLSDHEEKHIRAKGYIIASFLLLSILVFIAYQAILRIWSPVPILTGYMKLGVGIGLAGNIIALLILKKIRSVSETKEKMHSILSLDAVFDLVISVIVLISAFFIHLTSLIDPFLTLSITAVIGYKGIKLLISKTEHHHH